MKLQNKSKYQILLHLGLWALSFLGLYRLFTIDYSTGIGDLIFTSLFHFPLFVAVYVNLFLMRRYFLRRKFKIYSVQIISVMFFCAGLYFLIFNHLGPLFLKGFYFIAYYDYWDICQFVFVYISVSFLLYLSFNWFLLKNNQLRLERENHLTKLRNLKAQINPHFLFNSLNNIYGSTSEAHVKNYLQQLADSLRYVIYDAQVDFVSMASEIAYLKNYIELEKLRMESCSDIRVEADGPFDRFMIAPLLLLPLVENCFKHVANRDPFISIAFIMRGETFIFTTENNVSDTGQDKKSGIGLTNVNQRLNLIYPDRSSLTYQRLENRFELKLKIEMSVHEV